MGDAADARDLRSLSPQPANDRIDDGYPEPVIEGKWAPWLVSTIMIVLCAAFWAGVIWLGFRMFS